MNQKVSIRQHLMTGVSYMIPFVVIGGIFIALAIALSPINKGGGPAVTNPFLVNMLNMGVAAIGMMVPVLAGFIAYSIADRPGIAPGVVGGLLANQIKAGFLGGIIVGFLAGYVVNLIKKYVKVPDVLLPIMPIFVIPLLGTIVVWLVMQYVLGQPIAALMTAMTNGLQGMAGGSKVILGALLGLMIAFDMGGPVNKVAYTFGVAMIGANMAWVMGPIGAAICVPPIGMAVATYLAPKKYSPEERQAGTAALLMGSIGITEGAIPFAAADPLRVIPSIMAGGAVAGMVGMMLKTADWAPHGGLIVIPVVENVLGYVISIAAGVVVTAVVVNVLKKNVAQDESRNQAA